MSNKKFRLAIDIKALIHDKIPTKLIEKIVKDVDKANNLPLYQPNTEKHQTVIDFIKKNKNFHEKCITADLCFKINHDGIEDELDIFLDPRNFDRIALDAGEEMAGDMKDFITLLYEKIDSMDADDKIDEDGNPLPQKLSKKQALEALKREIDRRIIQESLLDYKITGASLKEVKNVPPKVN